MRENYLNRMGIVAWQLRSRTSADAFFQVQLKNAAGEIMGLIIAEIDSVVSVESQEQLLRKIAEAITVHYDCHRCASPDVSAEYRFVIFLGKPVFFDKEKAEQVICAHTLSDLMHHAEMKKALWIEIKKLRESGKIPYCI